MAGSLRVLLQISEDFHNGGKTCKFAFIQPFLHSPLIPNCSLFGIGDFGSVRGYRQDQLLTDNGIFASAEVQIPIAQIRNKGNHHSGRSLCGLWQRLENAGENPDPGTLASLGLGLQFRQSARLTARVDWGIPLISVESRNRTWQENDLYFYVVYNAF